MESSQNDKKIPRWRRFSSSRRSSSQGSTESSETNNSSRKRTSFDLIWTHLSRKPFTDSTLDTSETHDLTNLGESHKLAWSILKRKVKLGFQKSYILFVTFFLFLAISVTGTVVIVSWASSDKESYQSAQFVKGEDMVDLIDDELYKAQLPLFTLAEMAKQLSSFQSLPTNVSNAPLFTLNNTNYRDVKSICSEENDTPRNEFLSFSSTFKNNTQMPSGLIQAHLSPNGVVCFEYQYVDSLDTKNLQGFDVFNNSNTEHYALQSTQTNSTSLQGPLKLNDIHDKVLIARYPFYSSEMFWGFSSVILDWKIVERELGIYEYFDNLNMDFALLRPEYESEFDLSQQDSKQNMAFFAGSQNGKLLDETNSKLVQMKLFQSGWVLRMGYARHQKPSWLYWGPFVVIFVGAISSLAIMIILVDKNEHEKQLYRMMPRRFIRRLQKGRTIIERYRTATLCTLDIVSFTTISGSMSATEVMEMLKFVYTIFDKLARKHNVINVETIGDAYIVIGGGPDQSDPVEGAKRVVSFALDVVEHTRKLQTEGGKWRISVRAGVASGPVIAGVVGTELVPKLTLFGKTVHLAECLEASSMANEVLCSRETCKLLQECKSYSFACELRNDGKTIRCHGKKIKDTFWVKGVKKELKERKSEILMSTIDLDIETRFGDEDKIENGSVTSGVTDNSDLNSQECRNDLSITPEKVANGTKSIPDTSNYASVDISKGDHNPDAYAYHVEPLNTRKNSISFSLTEGIVSGSEVGRDESKSYEKNRTSHRLSSFSSKRSSKSGVDDETFAHKDGSAYHDYWTLLSKNHDKWQVQIDEENKRLSFLCFVRALYSSLAMFFQSVKRAAYVAFGDKKIILIIALSFIIICSVGVGIVLGFAKTYESNSRKNAIEIAHDTDLRLGNELQEKLIPLFALGTLAENLPFFRVLPSQMEAIPTYLNRFNNTYRNVTGVCDDTNTRSVFYDMASSIKQAADLRKVLVNLQLAPHGVLCLTYPLNNTEDFDDGRYLDTSGAIGLDLLEDSTRSALTKKAAKDDRWTIQGPIKLVQRDSSVVDQAIIGRYPMKVPYHDVTIDGKSYDLWGFSIALMDWDKLKETVGLYEFFERNSMAFKMTSTDTIVNQQTNEKTYKVKTIAESNNSHILHDGNTESIHLESTDNNWVLVVGFESGFEPTWESWSLAFAIVSSFLLSLLMCMVLVASKQHELLLYRMMPKDAIRKLRRGETVVDKHQLSSVFFSHIIGFTTLSGEMEPDEFMVMLNQIYDAFDKLTVKHQVSKIETIGDHYIVTAVGPNKSTDPIEGTVRVALFAEEAMQWVRQYHYKGMNLFIRAGIASGPMVSGVIGAAVPKYTIFGDTVNFASRMESTSKSMKIQISERTYEILQSNVSGYKFHMEERVEHGLRGLMVKGKGLRYTWWLEKSEKENDYISECNLDDRENEEINLENEAINEKDERSKQVSFSTANVGKA